MATTITPVLFYRDPLAAMRWLEAAFGFETTMLVTDDAGAVGHSELRLDGAAVSVGGEWASADLLGPATMKSPQSIGGVGTQFLRLSIQGLDAHCERARAAGARITQDPTDQFYGERTYRALDCEGHVWNFAEPVQVLSIEEMEKASGLTFKTSL